MCTLNIRIYLCLSIALTNSRNLNKLLSFWGVQNRRNDKLVSNRSINSSNNNVCFITHEMFGYVSECKFMPCVNETERVGEEHLKVWNVKIKLSKISAITWKQNRHALLSPFLVVFCAFLNVSMNIFWIENCLFIIKYENIGMFSMIFQSKIAIIHKNRS